MKLILTTLAIAALLAAAPTANAQGRNSNRSFVQGNVATQNQAGEFVGNRQGLRRGHNQGQVGQRKGQGQGLGRGRARGLGRGQGQGLVAPSAGQSQPVSSGATSMEAVPPAQLYDYLKCLQATLGEDLYARDYYLAASAALGEQKYEDLSNAEQKNANAVAEMISQLGGTPVWQPSLVVVTPAQVIETNAEGVAFELMVMPPATVAEANAECKAIELKAIGVYDQLIQDCLAPKILPKLKSIQAANHKCLSGMGD